jgi:hypothetical protein
MSWIKFKRKNQDERSRKKSKTRRLAKQNIGEKEGG